MEVSALMPIIIHEKMAPYEYPLLHIQYNELNKGIDHPIGWSSNQPIYNEYRT
jgi:hypothetical protein